MRNAKEQKPLVLKQPLSIQRVVISFEDRKKKQERIQNATDIANFPIGQSSPDNIVNQNKDISNHDIVAQIKTPRIEDAIFSKISSLSAGIDSPSLPEKGSKKNTNKATNFKIQQTREQWDSTRDSETSLSSPHNTFSAVSGSPSNFDEITSASSWDENDFPVLSAGELPLTFVTKIQIRPMSAQSAVQQKKKSIQKLSNVIKPQYYEDHEEPITYISPQIPRPRPQSAIKAKPGVRIGPGVSVQLNPRFCASYKKYQWDYRALVDTLIEVKMEEKETGIQQPDPAELAKLQLQQRQERDFRDVDQNAFVINGVHPPESTNPKQTYLKKMDEGKRRRRNEMARDFLNQEKLFSRHGDAQTMTKRASSFLPLSRPISAVSRLQRTSGQPASHQVLFPARENPKTLQFTNFVANIPSRFSVSGGFTARQPSPSPRIDSIRNYNKQHNNNPNGLKRPQSANPRLSRANLEDTLMSNDPLLDKNTARLMKRGSESPADENMKNGNEENEDDTAAEAIMNEIGDENDSTKEQVGTGIEIESPNPPDTPAEERKDQNAKIQEDISKIAIIENSPNRPTSPAPVKALTIKRKDSLPKEDEIQQQANNAKPKQVSQIKNNNRTTITRFPQRPSSANPKLAHSSISNRMKVQAAKNSSANNNNEPTPSTESPRPQPHLGSKSSMMASNNLLSDSFLRDSSAISMNESMNSNNSLMSTESLDAEVENANRMDNSALNLSTDSSVGLSRQALQTETPIKAIPIKTVTFQLDNQKNNENNRRQNESNINVKISKPTHNNNANHDKQQEDQNDSPLNSGSFFQAFKKPSSPVPPDAGLKTKEQARNLYGNAQHQKMLTGMMKKK